MNVQNINRNFNISFTSKEALSAKKQAPDKRLTYDKNPINPKGERSNALLATAAAGLLFGVRVLFGILDDGDGAQFVGEMAEKVSDRIQKRKGVNPKQTLLNKIGGPIAVLAAFVGVMAFIYTLYNMPKTLYNAKVNTFKKSKEMDVYIKGNAVEKELYNQMNEKAQNANEDDKAELNKQYAKLKAAKNVVPDFVKLKQNELEK